MSFRPNFILQTDSYKQYHWMMRIHNTTRTYSYLSSRIGAKHAWNTAVGLQYYLKEYLEGPRVTRADIEEALDYLRAHFKYPQLNPMWSHIVETYDGRLPLRILAWDEGSRVPMGYPTFTVVNTDPRCEALTNHVEPLLCKVWYPMTVATISGYVIGELLELVRASGGPDIVARYMLHDFGYRGASSEETARIGGMAHLVHSQGTDTLQGMKQAAHYYGASLQDLASSVVASEHSIMTAGGPQEEVAIARHIIETHPDQTISLVADSYDYYAFVDAMIDLKPVVDQHRVKLVIRPDSVTPQHPDPKDLVLWTLNRYLARMPYTITPTGHRETPYSVLWSDGLVPDKIIDIASAVVVNGFAAHNTAYGMGGGLLQKVDRDTERFAMKSSAQERDGQWVKIQKNPLDKSKASLAGRLQVVNLTGHDDIVPEEQWANPDDPRVRLKLVFENGEIVRQHTFEQIRARARVRSDPHRSASAVGFSEASVVRS